MDFVSAYTVNEFTQALTQLSSDTRSTRTQDNTCRFFVVIAAATVKPRDSLTLQAQVAAQ
jgi:hypothetical protein